MSTPFLRYVKAVRVLVNFIILTAGHLKWRHLQLAAYNETAVKSGFSQNKNFISYFLSSSACSSQPFGHCFSQLFILPVPVINLIGTSLDTMLNWGTLPPRIVNQETLVLIDS
jgi:hypothetical protein